MQQEKVKRLAADVLHCGRNSVWLNPEEGEKISSVMTKDDVRALVKDGIIKKRQQNAHSRFRARLLQKKKKKGRKRGSGKRKGLKSARAEKKPNWMKNVRSQRRMLRQLRKEKKNNVEKIGYRKLYMKIKGGYFKGKNYLKAAVEGKKG